jgi:hypothetical protein
MSIVGNRWQTPALERLVNGADVIGMVVSIVLLKYLDAHAKVIGGLPHISSLLHQPRRCGVPECVGCDVRQSKLFSGPLEREPNTLDRLAV